MWEAMITFNGTAFKPGWSKDGPYMLATVKRIKNNFISLKMFFVFLQEGVTGVSCQTFLNTASFSLISRER